MYLFLLQCVTAVLALLISFQGLAEVNEGFIGGILKTAACPLVWMYLAKKLNSFHPSILFLVGGIAFAVLIIPSVMLPAISAHGDSAFSLLGFATFSSLVVLSAYHARWAQVVLFKDVVR